MHMVTTKQTGAIAEALNTFQIELPSWGFANTGTRFGKFLQAAAAGTLAEKFSDAGHGEVSHNKSTPAVDTPGTTPHLDNNAPVVIIDG